MEPLALQITADGLPAPSRPDTCYTPAGPPRRTSQQPSPPENLKYLQLCCKISCFKIPLVSKHLTEIHGHWAVPFRLRKAGNSFPSPRKALKHPPAQRVRSRTRTCPTTPQPQFPGQSHEVTRFPPALAGELYSKHRAAGKPLFTAQEALLQLQCRGTDSTTALLTRPGEATKGCAQQRH